MSEQWRVKRYYRTRVLIDTDDVITPAYDSILVCLEPSELAMLRQITQYLHRRSTFASEYSDNYYLAPSDEQWDSLQAIVAGLEEKLMAGCDEIVAALETIATNTACICNNLTNPPLAQPGPAYDAVIEEYLGDGTLSIDDNNGGTLPADAERCALAQLTYAFMFEFMDETVIPTEKVLVDIILPLAVGAVTSAIGTPLLGVPVAAITATLIALGDLAADNELANLRNALFANKEELVCAMYSGLEVSYAQAHNQAAAIVNDMESLGATDKIIVRALLAPWAMAQCKRVYDAATSWATSNVTANYCVACEDITQGTDWFAVPCHVPMTVDHPSGGGYWARQSWCEPIYPNKTVVGFIIETTAKTGDCGCVTDSDATDCTGTTISVNSSSDITTLGSYYFYRSNTHQNSEAVAELAPGATQLSNQIQYPVSTTGNFRVSLREGYNCIGSITCVLHYVVYAGSPD